MKFVKRIRTIIQQSAMNIILQFNSKTELKTEDTNAARAALYVLHWKQ